MKDDNKFLISLPSRINLLPAYDDYVKDDETFVSEILDEVLSGKDLYFHQKGSYPPSIQIVRRIFRLNRSFIFQYVFPLDNGNISPATLDGFRFAATNFLRNTDSVYN